MTASTLVITQRHGIWRVTLDGQFFSDFRSKDHAMESAEEARRDMAAGGRTARVVFAAEKQS